MWQAVFDLVKNISEVLLSSLPNFWKISKNFADGKYKKVSAEFPTTQSIRTWSCLCLVIKSLSSGSRRSPTQCRTMVLDCVRLYISLISEFFHLSDIVVMLSAGLNKNVPLTLPMNVHSIATAHHLMKLSGEIQDNVNDINGMDISSEVSSSLRSLLESVKWRFIDILMHVWFRGVDPLAWLATVLTPVWSDANLFYHLEGWRADASNQHITQHLSHMEQFQRHLTTAAFKIAGGVDMSSSVSLSKPVKQNAIPQVFVTRITKGFLDALYAFLDGLVLLASDESPIVTGSILAKAETSGTNHLDLFDLSDGVSPSHLCDDTGLTHSGIISFYCTFELLLLYPVPNHRISACCSWYRTLNTWLMCWSRAC